MGRILWFCCSAAVFFSSFIQSCKAAVWYHQSQSLCTSCASLIGCNDLRMSLRTLICFSSWPICLPVLPRAAGCLPRTCKRVPPTLHSLHIIIIPRLCLLCLLVASVTYGYHLHTVYGAIGVYSYEKLCLWKSILWITDESYLLTFDRKVPINIQLDVVTHVEEEECGNFVMWQVLTNQTPFLFLLYVRFKKTSF